MFDATLSAPPAPAGQTPATDGRAAPAVYEIFLENVVLPCRIGVYAAEREAPQRVRIDLTLDVREDRARQSDDIGDVLSYDDIMDGLRRITMADHTNLAETLCEKIAAMCLRDERVQRARVSVAKLDIYASAGAGVPGVRIDRRRG